MQQNLLKAFCPYRILIFDGFRSFKIIISHLEFCFFIINPFLANVPILHALKTPENQRFSGVFRGCKMGTLVKNGLIKLVLSSSLITSVLLLVDVSVSSFSATKITVLFCSCHAKIDKTWISTIRQNFHDLWLTSYFCFNISIILMNNFFTFDLLLTNFENSWRIFFTFLQYSLLFYGYELFILFHIIYPPFSNTFYLPFLLLFFTADC